MKKISVQLDSLADICFDRFIDHSGEKRPPEQKFYLSDGGKVVLPGDNIDSFLFGQSPKGAALSFEGKRGKEFSATGQGHVLVNEPLIPFLVNGKPVKFEGFGDEKPFWVTMYAPRTKNGSLSIKQEVNPRPALRHPWRLVFTISLQENHLIDDTKLYNWFVQGGILIGLGNHRPKFGRFFVAKWEVEET